MYLSLILCLCLWMMIVLGSENYWDVVMRLLFLLLCMIIVVLNGVWDIILGGNMVNMYLMRWMEVGMIREDWIFMLDGMTILMLSLISGVSILVHIYSIDYMGDETKFMLYISLFTILMMILVLGGNILILFVGWEGVGVCSYLLITYWNKRVSGSKSGIQAMIMNRIGDVGLVLGMLLLLDSVFSIDMMSIRMMNGMNEVSMIVGICILIGGVGKSAQIGLHVWLPNAMEGPTPVSALIHAATMVTSGIYILGRCSSIIEENMELMSIIRVVGGLSLLISGFIGMKQNDMKRVIAYSTGSQLGYMILCCGLSSYHVGLFHMLNHGCFKASLFLGGGSVIHGLSDVQDMRRMGGLLSIYPITYVVMLIGSISLMGLPYMSGYYSKDVIIEIAYMEGLKMEYIVCLLGVLTTSIYSSRLLYLSFLGDIKGYKYEIESGHESIDMVSIVLTILTIGSIGIGYVIKDMMIEMGTDQIFSNSVYISMGRDMVIEGELGILWGKWIPLVICIIGGYIGIYMNQIYSMSIIDIRLTKLLNRKYYFEKIYNEFIGQRLLNIGNIDLYNNIDKGLLEMLGGLNGNRMMTRLGYNDMMINNGGVSKAIYITVGIGILLLIFITN